MNTLTIQPFYLDVHDSKNTRHVNIYILQSWLFCQTAQSARHDVIRLMIWNLSPDLPDLPNLPDLPEVLHLPFAPEVSLPFAARYGYKNHNKEPPGQVITRREWKRLANPPDTSTVTDGAAELRCTEQRSLWPNPSRL